jgi:DNA-binding transcriptional ArsR family regulator
MYQSKVFARRRRAPLPAAAAVPPLPSALQMQPRAAEAAALLKALGNPARLLLACHLAEGEHSVGELGLRTGIDQPNLSQQLGVLREQGLVATRRDGKHVHYHVASPAALALLRSLNTIYCAPQRGAG